MINLIKFNLKMIEKAIFVKNIVLLYRINYTLYNYENLLIVNKHHYKLIFLLSI